MLLEFHFCKENGFHVINKWRSNDLRLYWRQIILFSRRKERKFQKIQKFTPEINGLHFLKKIHLRVRKSMSGGRGKRGEGVSSGLPAERRARHGVDFTTTSSWSESKTKSQSPDLLSHPGAQETNGLYLNQNTVCHVCCVVLECGEKNTFDLDHSKTVFQVAKESWHWIHLRKA